MESEEGQVLKIMEDAVDFVSRATGIHNFDVALCLGAFQAFLEINKHTIAPGKTEPAPSKRFRVVSSNGDGGSVI